ncbi:glutathione S-transferase family protein [Sphingomonas sp. 1P06PA]|uniref:glutathione S-transferase family protein n=1 Tax=Sphingomonas sp. 1P06PA TaxID=554121 RepID=UPI0039A7491D
MILYGSSLSPFVRKVIAFAAEKGIELEVRGIPLGSPDPEFRAASPLGKMPALIDGDFSIPDSTAIVTYLDAVAPGPRLIPDEPRLRARAYWWDEFADTELFGCGRQMFFNRLIGPLFLKVAGDEAAALKAETEQLPKLLAYLDGVVPDEGYLLGDAITLADIAVASPFANLRHLDLEPTIARYPRVAAYVDRILARPSFAEMVAKEARLLDRAKAA